MGHVSIGNARESRKAEEQGAPGYSNNAESEFGRRAASGGKAEVVPSLRERQSWMQWTDALEPSRVWQHWT